MKTCDTNMTNDTFPDTLLFSFVFFIMGFIVILVGCDIKQGIDNLTKSISKLPAEFIEIRDAGKFKDVKIFIKDKGQ